MKKIGFIGLGSMGSGMVCNLLEKGFDVMVHDIDRQKVREGVDCGAKEAANYADLCTYADFIGLSLPNTEIVSAVLKQPGGIFEQAKPGTLIVDFSTIAPAGAKNLHAEATEKGFLFLDAPVSGGVGGARNGKLTIMVGGQIEVLEKADEVLQAMAIKVVHIGAEGAGQYIKLAQNLIGALNVTAAAEGITMAVKAGVDPLIAYDVLSSSAASGWLLENYIPVQMAKGYQPPSFALDLMLKDVRLALKAAEDIGARTFLGAVAAQLYSTVQSFGKGGLDYASIFQLYEQLNDIEGITALKAEK